jgi:hypothetical protein
MFRACLVHCVLLIPAAGVAEPTFYFGQQYDGIEDSPFAIEHLEDFEDGLFNQPGVSVFSGYDPLALLVAVSVPGEFTNSVDGGQNGYSFVPAIYQTDLSNPPTLRSALKFVFDDPQTNVGMAITKVSSPDIARLDFRVYGPTGEEVDRYETLWTDVTVETPFIGASDPEGISAVHLIVWATGGPSSAFQIDHLQYGAPEPSTLLLGLLAAVCGVFVRLRS